MLQRAYELKGSSDTGAFYRDWAEKYDSTMMAGLDYLTPARTSDLLASKLEGKDAAILDVGCGTGLAGAKLKQRGFDAIDGLDFSADMLAVAGKRGIYRRLMEADLNQPLDITSQVYQALICTGTFTHAHVGADCLDELFRILEPGGLFACTVHKDVWKPAGFAEKTRSLERTGVLETLVQQPGPYFATSAQADGDYIVWRKSK